MLFKEYNRLLITKSLSLEEEKIIKDIRNIFRFKKRTELHCKLKQLKIE